MRKYLKDRFIEEGWLLGEGDLLATKIVGDCKLVIEHHRVKGYLTSVRKYDTVVRRKLAFGLLEEAMGACDLYEGLLEIDRIEKPKPVKEVVKESKPVIARKPKTKKASLKSKSQKKREVIQKENNGEPANV